MPLARWLEFHRSTIVAVHGSPDCVCVELDGYIHQWDGAGSSRRGTGWMQHVRIEIDFPEVDQGISLLPTALSRGALAFDPPLKNRDGGLSVPMAIEAMIVLELVATSGEKLKISGERIRANTSAEPRFVEEIPRALDPAREAN